MCTHAERRREEDHSCGEYPSDPRGCEVNSEAEVYTASSGEHRGETLADRTITRRLIQQTQNQSNRTFNMCRWGSYTTGAQSDSRLYRRGRHFSYIAT